VGGATAYRLNLFASTDRTAIPRTVKKIRTDHYLA